LIYTEPGALDIEIPDFDANGNLPVGIDDSTIEGVTRRFGGSRSLRRKQLSRNLNDFYQFIRHHALDLYVDGSYVTAKLSPGDVDLLLLLPAGFPRTPAFTRYYQFEANYPRYRLHLLGCIEGVDDAKFRARLRWFMTDKTLQSPKGIVRLEIQR
jgi:hypothetical protein